MYMFDWFFVVVIIIVVVFFVKPTTHIYGERERGERKTIEMGNLIRFMEYGPNEEKTCCVLTEQKGKKIIKKNFFCFFF